MSSTKSFHDQTLKILQLLSSSLNTGLFRCNFVLNGLHLAVSLIDYISLDRGVIKIWPRCSECVPHQPGPAPPQAVRLIIDLLIKLAQMMLARPQPVKYAELLSQVCCMAGSLGDTTFQN